MTEGRSSIEDDVAELVGAHGAGAADMGDAQTWAGGKVEWRPCGACRRSPAECNRDQLVPSLRHWDPSQFGAREFSTLHPSSKVFPSPWPGVGIWFSYFFISHLASPSKYFQDG